MKKLFLPLALLFSITCLFHSCSGQSGPNKNIQNATGNQLVVGDTVSRLGDNIMVAYQDSKNVYWFGSWETGLYKYDGKTLLNYTIKHGLPQNRIDEIKEDSYGNIYINSLLPSLFITQFDGKRFTPLTPRPSTDWRLQPGDVWFKSSGYNGNVYRFDGKVLHDLPIPKHPTFNNPYEIYSIYKDSKGNMWFGSNPLGVLRYNGKLFNWITENDVTELDGGPANGVRSIIEDKEGYFWFNSAFRYKVSDSLKAPGAPFYERQKSIGNLDGKTDSNLHEYLSIAKDNNGNLWIATYRNGVWMYDGSSVKHYAVQEDGKDINLFYVYKDNKGTLWLSTHNNGVWRFTGQQFERFMP